MNSRKVASLDPRILDYIGLLISCMKADISCILLFGSRASGTERPDSDYDIAIVTRPAVAPIRLLRRSSDLSYMFVVEGLDIRPVIVGREVIDSRSEFGEHLRAYGLTLYATDD